MTYYARLRRAAEDDVANAQTWYEAKVPGLGDALRAEVARALGRVEGAPFMYAKQYGEVRRALVHRFPYLVWYRITGNKVQVLAVTDSRQDPAKVEANVQ